MKVLLDTCLGQGRKAHDVCTTLEGELVALHTCANDCYVCRRALIGLVSGHETTTFMAIDRPEDPDDGWLDELVDELLETAEFFPTGVILDRVDSEFGVR